MLWISESARPRNPSPSSTRRTFWPNPWQARKGPERSSCPEDFRRFRFTWDGRTMASTTPATTKVVRGSRVESRSMKRTKTASVGAKKERRRSGSGISSRSSRWPAKKLLLTQAHHGANGPTRSPEVGSCRNLARIVALQDSSDRHRPSIRTTKVILLIPSIPGSGRTSTRTLRTITCLLSPTSRC